MKSSVKTAPVTVPGSAPRVLIVEARFYHELADELLAGARATLQAAGAVVEVMTVPGALEIPAVISMYEDAAPFDGYVALGTVIRGETTHYDVVAGESCRALMDLAVHYAIAIGNGILTVENEAQAYTRARASEMDKGGGAASACLTMIALARRLREQA